MALPGPNRIIKVEPIKAPSPPKEKPVETPKKEPAKT